MLLVVKVTERVSTSDDPTIKIPKPSLPDYKLPLDYQREFLAIPNGWRRIDILLKIYNILKTI